MLNNRRYMYVKQSTLKVLVITICNTLQFYTEPLSFIVCFPYFKYRPASIKKKFNHSSCKKITSLPALFYHVLLMGDDLNKFVRVKLPHMSEKLKASKGGFGDNFWRITNHTEKYFKYRPVCIRKKQFQLLFMQKIFS